MGPYDELSRAAFSSFNGDSFDPENYDPEMYDGENATGQMMQRSPRRPGSFVKPSPARSVAQAGLVAAQFDLKITNSDTTQDITIELFNAQNSDAKTRRYATPWGPGVNYNPIYGAGNLVGDPITGATFFGSLASAYQVGSRFVGFTGDGTKTYTTQLGGVLGFRGVNIECKQIPYVALFEYSQRMSFIIDSMRMNFSASAQIYEDFTTLKRTFLGAVSENTISPKSYFRPDQYQNLIVDVPLALPITGERGLRYKVLAGQTVDISLFIKAYEKNTL